MAESVKSDAARAGGTPNCKSASPKDQSDGRAKANSQARRKDFEG